MGVDYASKADISWGNDDGAGREEDSEIVTM
jgi:hypothetical protein